MAINDCSWSYGKSVLYTSVYVTPGGVWNYGQHDMFFEYVDISIYKKELNLDSEIALEISFDTKLI